MAARPSLEEVLRGVAPEKLDQPCRDDHLSEIALTLTDWQLVASFLGLTDAEEEEIKEDSQPARRRKVAMLRRWKKKYGEKATYRKLAQVFWRLKRQDLVEELCKLLNESTSRSDSHNGSDSINALPLSIHNTDNDRNIGVHQPNICNRLWTKIRGTRRSVLNAHVHYLRSRYQTKIPSFLTLQWPPPPTRHVFNLAMIQGQNIRYGPIDEDMVRLMLQGRVNDILHQKTPVKLKDVFKMDDAKRKVILIEGAPGSGKSTLAWYICKKWGSRKLFKDFRTVVFVQLRDPAIQSARSVEDILPAESRSQAARVLVELQACRGRGLLWVMDGWDELLLCLRTNSVFHELIAAPEMCNLPFSTVIITSRPIASGDLHRVISSRVEILGFTPIEVKSYFTEAVGGNSQALQKLQDQLRERPVIEASCYLPLNAAIVAHLFLSQKHGLPTTLHGVFTSLVLCCLVRQATKEGKAFGDISSLDNLPPCLQTPLDNICALAYHAVISVENKVTFSTTELDSLRLSGELATLGLIQGVESFASFKKSVSFNFLQLSVQELLASFYISKLPQNEQVEVFKILFGQPRFATVFRFYAAFTKLETEGIREIIANIVKKKEKPQLLYLLNGLYEAQDLSLCQFVGSQLGEELKLNDTTLSPVDCLSVGYFISCNCLTTGGDFIVNLSGCSLDDYRVSFLVQELLKCRTQRTTGMDAGMHGCVNLKLFNNSILGNGTRCIAELISHSAVISKLSLRGNIIEEGERGIYHLSQALRTNTSLVKLDLGSCGITAKGVKVLSDALSVNKHLSKLLISSNQFGDRGLASLYNNLKTCHLKELSIENCGITEKGVKVLADFLLTPMNGSLELLHVGENAISDAGVACIAKSLEQNKTLKLLSVKMCGITEKGAESLVDCLMVNQSIKVLDLDNNHILDFGATLIANALPRNHTLKELRLPKCGLTDQCMGPLAHALEMNTSLETLELDFNQFTDTGLVVLGENLKKNRGLLTLKLRWLEKVTGDGLKQFVLSLQENCYLTKLEVGGGFGTGGGREVVQDEADIVNERRQGGITALTVC